MVITIIWTLVFALIVYLMFPRGRKVVWWRLHEYILGYLLVLPLAYFSVMSIVLQVRTYVGYTDAVCPESPIPLICFLGPDIGILLLTISMPFAFVGLMLFYRGTTKDLYRMRREV